MTIIFSDTHLTHEFNQPLFDKLKNLIKNADTVIINGDFWDGYLTTFDQFIQSDWQQLFPLLKKKQAIYLFGNHDPAEFADSRYALFSHQQLSSFEFNNTLQKFHVEHGHLLNFNLTFTTKFLVPTLRYAYQVIVKQKKEGTILGKFFGEMMHLMDVRSDIVIHEAMKNKTRNEYFSIFGHTHIPLFSEELRYANPGRFTSPDWGYIEITDTSCKVKKLT